MKCPYCGEQVGACPRPWGRCAYVTHGDPIPTRHVIAYLCVLAAVFIGACMLLPR